MLHIICIMKELTHFVFNHCWNCGLNVCHDVEFEEWEIRLCWCFLCVQTDHMGNLDSNTFLGDRAFQMDRVWTVVSIWETKLVRLASSFKNLKITTSLFVTVFWLLNTFKTKDLKNMNKWTKWYRFIIEASYVLTGINISSYFNAGVLGSHAHNKVKRVDWGTNEIWIIK